LQYLIAERWPACMHMCIYIYICMHAHAHMCTRNCNGSTSS
jgi:hypothetical protein